MRLESWIGWVFLVGCGGGAAPCEPLDETSCGPDELCVFDASGTRCRGRGRLGVSQDVLEPCTASSGDRPCTSGFVCQSYECVDGALGMAVPSQQADNNGCLPLCDEPAPADPNPEGPQCVAFNPRFGAASHGLALTTELIDQACDR